MQVEKRIWYDVKSIADYLCVSKETIYRLLKKKQIPSHRVGKTHLFNVNEIDSWVLADKSVNVLVYEKKDLKQKRCL